MRRLVVPFLSAVAIAMSAGNARAQTAGINMGAPVWNGVVAIDATKAAVSTGAHHVRVNFRLDVWKSPNDPGFIAAYDAIIDGITSQGLEVYGLVSDELSTNDDEYVAFATAVIDRYKDRVRVWETINEPNDWAGGTSARFTAGRFADVHGRLYSAVKVAHPGDACWDVKLVTGPLFSFDGNSSASYLAEVIDQGRAGGGWKSVRDVLGKDPVDDVGYHVYVAQGSDSADDDVAPSANANLDALKNVLSARGLGDRRIWISEVGYQAELLGNDGQAARLDATFAALSARSDVASIQWFTIEDFGGMGWGVRNRPAYAKLVAQAKAHAPERAAKLVVDLPKRAAIGAPVVAKITATNLGKKTWTTDAVRLGAASGCPAAWSVNGWTWAPSAADGHSASLTDARRFLPKGATVAQGESITFDVPLASATEKGKLHFAARMLEEGVAWFGSTASADVEIVESNTGDEPPADAPDPGAPSSSAGEASSASSSATSGCSSSSSGAARGVSFAAILVAFGVFVRRRTSRH